MRGHALGLRLAGAGVGLPALTSAAQAATAPPSAITAVEVAGTQSAGTLWRRRLCPCAHLGRRARPGRAPDEKVAGLAATPKDASGDYAYSAEFELIAPAAGGPANNAVFVEEP